VPIVIEVCDFATDERYRTRDLRELFEGAIAIPQQDEDDLVGIPGGNDKIHLAISIQITYEDRAAEVAILQCGDDGNRGKAASLIQINRDGSGSADARGRRIRDCEVRLPISVEITDDEASGRYLTSRHDDGWLERQLRSTRGQCA